MRTFGAPAGGHVHKKVASDSTNTTVVHPSEADLKYQIAEKYNYNDKFLFWVQGKYPFDRIGDKLTNDKVQKFSAYNMFKTNPML